MCSKRKNHNSCEREDVKSSLFLHNFKPIKLSMCAIWKDYLCLTRWNNIMGICTICILSIVSKYICFFCV